MIDLLDLRELVVRPTLKLLEPEISYSKAAEELLIRTCCAESGAKKLRQHRGGPALGLWQMEPATHEDIWNTYLKFRSVLEAKVKGLISFNRVSMKPPPSHELVTNLRYACALARIKYWRAPDALPKRDDIKGMAKYWKKHYNTAGGKGTIKHFIESYPGLEE